LRTVEGRRWLDFKLNGHQHMYESQTLKGEEEKKNREDVLDSRGTTGPR